MAEKDLAHVETDKILLALEQKINRIYANARDDMSANIAEYFAYFKKREARQRKLLEQGKITEQDFKQWRLNQMARGERYVKMRDEYAERMTNANEVATAYINDTTPSIYSLNRNYSAYTIEQVAGDVGFTLYDERTVKRLIKDEPNLMPYYPPKKAIKRGIDLEYGKQKITENITSGILQGKSIPNISKSLQQDIPTMNRNSAIRTARTAATGAQNAGRMDSYHAAKEMGIKLKKQWLATLDGRTRHEHAMLDGQAVDEDKPFKVGGYEIMFPGDPSAAAEMVYNCRCTTVAQIDGVDMSDIKRRAVDPETGETVLIENMTYAEWAGWKETSVQTVEKIEETIEKKVDEKVDKKVEEKIVEKADKKIDEALEYYVSGDGMWINSYLRGNDDLGELSDDEDEILKNLTKATDKKYNGQDTLYRSVDAAAIFGEISDTDYENMLSYLAYGEENSYTKKAADIVSKVSGKEITEKGFLSTTKDMEIADDWGGFSGSSKPIVLEIATKDKAKGVDLSKFDLEDDPQKEVLLARGTKYKIKKVYFKNHNIHVQAELL